METKDRGGLALARAVQTAYREGQTDYSLEPMVRVDEQGRPVGTIQDGDSVIFCCRRGEREIELTEAFTEPDFDRFPRVPLKNLEFVIMTMYHEKFKHLPIAFAPEKTVRPLAQVISEAGLRQFHCAESEKYAHVTFFFNGGENQPFPGEDDVRIPSPKGIPFDQKPELSLPQVADRVMAAADTGYDFILTNFANGDVIGHTANAEAKLTACHVVSQQVARVASHALEKGYIVCITADHGNIETLRTEDGKPHVAHTTNLVPFLLLDPEKLSTAGDTGHTTTMTPSISPIPRPGIRSWKPGRTAACAHPVSRSDCRRENPGIRKPGTPISAPAGLWSRTMCAWTTPFTAAPSATIPYSCA